MPDPNNPDSDRDGKPRPVEHPVGQKILHTLNERNDIPWAVQELMREAQVALGGYWRRHPDV